MKKDKEFEREDLAVDRDIQLDSDNKQQIVAYLETLFDVNEKFNLQLDSEAGEWVNMYGIYNPLSDFLMRLDEEQNPKVKKMLKKDIEFLDQIQVEMATARQFLFIARCKEKKA